MASYYDLYCEDEIGIRLETEEGARYIVDTVSWVGDEVLAVGGHQFYLANGESLQDTARLCAVETAEFAIEAAVREAALQAKIDELTKRLAS